MTTINISLPRPHRLQQAILDDPARFRVVVCGRRFGKTEVAQHECIVRFFHQQSIWYCTPTYTLAEQVFDSLVKKLRHVPGIYINRTKLRLALGDGVITHVSVAEPDNLRGAGLDFVVLDEAAFMKDGIWDSLLRPMLATSEGSALFISSPYGRNWFWKLYTLGLDPLQSRWNSHRYSSADGGLISPTELEDIQRNTPERVFREEYLAEFLDDSGSVFRGVDDAVRVFDEQQPVLGREYIFGVDWGKSNDYTVITVVERDSGNVVAIDRFNQIDWTLQRGRLVALYDMWQPIQIIAESNSIGAPNIELLQAECLPVTPFETTNNSKTLVIEALALAVERGEIGLIADDVLLSELKAYEMERLPSGKFRYNAPSGTHDDTVIATALAWHGALQTHTYMDFY